jgi:hypothetical protein
MLMLQESVLAAMLPLIGTTNKKLVLLALKALSMTKPKTSVSALPHFHMLMLPENALIIRFREFESNIKNLNCFQLDPNVLLALPQVSGTPTL